MTSLATLVVLLTGTVPPELLDPAPGVLLRWPSLELVDDATSTPSSRLSPQTPLRFSVAGPAMVRLRGTFPEGCEPRPFRRSGDGPGWIDLPLRALRDGGDYLLHVTPALAPGFGDEETDKPASFRVELPSGCPATGLSAFRAVGEDDAYRAPRLALALRRWGHEAHSAAELQELLAQPFPHRWQELAALAAALPSLVASVPGDGAAAEELSHAWLEEAVVEAQADDLSLSFVSALSASLPRSSVAGTPQPFFRLEAGQALEAEVRGATVLRLFSRSPMEALQSVAVQRLEVQFDERPATPWHAASSRDPALPTFARQRGLVLPIPPGAQRVRVRSATPMLLRGLLVRHKAHLEDVSSLESATERLDRLASDEGADARSTVAAAIARAQLGRPESLQRLLGTPDLRGSAAAIAALVAAELTKDETVAAGLLARAETALAAVEGELERLARPLLKARILRARMRVLIATGRSSEAVRGWVEHAAERPLTSEDAATLAETDAFASEGLGAGAPVLAILDGLAASRPLDRDVLVARARAYALATGWYSLGALERTRETSFLEPTPEARPIAPERFAYARLSPEGEALTVVAPLSSLPNRKPVLSFVVARGTALARLITVRIDGAPKFLPALSSFDRFDVAVEPGKHQVILESADFAGEVFVNHAVALQSQYLRRYAELGPDGLEWRSREVGSAAVAGLAIRLVGALGAAPPDSLEVTLDGAGPQPLTLRLHPGPWRTDPAGDLPAGSVVTEPLEVSVPVTKANVFHLKARLPAGTRLLARLSLRRHRPVVPVVVDPEAVTGAGVALTDAGDALGAVSALSAKLAMGRPEPVTYIARAATLLELDELGLAREDLLAAIEERTLGAHQRALVTALWRSLDAIGSDHPASVPSGVEHLTPSLLLAAGHPEAMSIGLLALLDDSAALTRADPAELRRRAGEGAAGDLAVVIAASTAERGGDVTRAAELWLDLAQAHPDLALLRRVAGEALLRSPEPKATALAYLELSAACELEPRDAYAHRLLRQAAGRTRLRPLKFADQSAGTRAVLLSGGEPLDPTVEEAMLPPTAEAQDSFLLTRGRQARLSLSLNAPLELTLRAHVLELRGRERPLLGREPAGVEVVRDGEPPVRLECSAEGACRSAPIGLGRGTHVLEVRLVGGLRPAGRLWADIERGRAFKRGRPAQRVAAAHVSEYLVASANEPIELLVHGPALLRVEARSPLGRHLAAEAELTARAKGQAPQSRVVAIASEVDPRAALDAGGALSRATVTTLALSAPTVYRVLLRPRSGELLARIAARDAGAAEDEEPPPTLVFQSLTPPPAAPAPGVQEPLSAHVAGDGAAPGLDGLGSLEVLTRWSYEQFDPSGLQVQPSSALGLSLAYRRLLDPGWLTLKVAGGVRVPTIGGPGEWASAEAFFMHPELRALRALLSLGGKTQPVGTARLWAGSMGLMVQAVLTVSSGFHLVTKVGGRLAVLPALENPSDALLASVDPGLYNRYAAAHARALYLEELLQLEPLANLVLVANARATTNASLSPIDLDAVRAGVTARGLFGRTFAEAGFRLSWYFADRDRTRLVRSPVLSATVSHTFWLGSRHHLEVGASAAYDFRTNLPELAIVVAWEASNGRRFRDHTPLEGEDYFFPQRGPEAEAGRLEMGR